MHWYLYRPDAIYGIEIVKEYLPIYVLIVKREIPPRHMVLKTFEVDFNENSSLEKLFEIHDKSLEEFSKYYRKIVKSKESWEERQVKNNLLKLKYIIAKKILESCVFCERRCNVNRYIERGFCKVGITPKISSEFVHLGEESWITPSYTIFFAGCNFKCVYCQNYDISQFPKNGIEIPPEILASMIDSKFLEGARNVNWVGGEPTPNLHYIFETMLNVQSQIPVVWNSNAYESIEAQKLLAGFVDLYLYDFKYGNNACALKYSKVPKYFETVTRNFKFAILHAEISFRHLVLPKHIECCSYKILDWISENLSENFVINIMDQYIPYYKAKEHLEIARRIKNEEYEKVLNYAKRLELPVFS